MKKIKEMVTNAAETKNGKELIQVTIAFLAVGVLIFLRARGILVLENLHFAMLGGITVFVTLQYVAKKQKMRMLNAVLDEAEKAAEAENS